MPIRVPRGPETSLRGAVKSFLEEQGFEAKGEVRGCDIVAMRQGEPPVLVITELKMAFTLEFVLQGVERQRAADAVGLAVPATRRGRDRDRRAHRLCRLLGFGLLAVHAVRGSVEILIEPAPYRPRSNLARRRHLLKEHAARRGDPTPGGSTGQPIMTAYRQQALACAELWRQLQKQGFRGCMRVVSEWATRRRQADRTDNAPSRAPAARTIARLMTIGRDRLTRSEAVTVAAIEGGVPLLIEAREIIAAFQAMVRKRSLDALGPWLEGARSSLVASFASGVLKDRAAVAAAITSPWSNGQTEGQSTKLKLVKRQMYGRGTLDLLQARVIGAT